MSKPKTFDFLCLQCERKDVLVSLEKWYTCNTCWSQKHSSHYYCSQECYVVHKKEEHRIKSVENRDFWESQSE